MAKKKGNFFMGLLALSLVLGLLSGPAWGESTTTVGGSTAARLNFQINIPTILSLQVGTSGANVDTVSCGLVNIPGSGGVAMNSSGANPVPVNVAAVVPAGQAVRLTANSNTPMTNGSETINFDQITCAAGGAFSAYTFNNAATQPLDSFTGSGLRQGTYAFTYANTEYHGTGTYNGQVTYTLTSP